MELHSVANLFPPMSDDEFCELVEDIRENGQREPITLHNGQIVDGVHRYRACRELGIEPKTREWEGVGSLVTYVVSVNLKRRHLSSSQRAIVAADALQMYETEAKQRQRQHGNTAPGKPKSLPERIPEVIGDARDHAAEDFGTNPRYVSDAAKLQRDAPGLAKEVREGKRTLPSAMRVHYSSDSEEWYTPSELVDCVVGVLGEIDLDPCSNSQGKPNVPAKKHLTIKDDGLTKPWAGRVYMNPPYGRGIDRWVEKLVYSFTTGMVTEAIALVPARTDTSWFRKLREHPRCFVSGRLKFSDHENAAPFPSMAVYLGPNLERFKAMFAELGDIYRLVA